MTTQEIQSAYDSLTKCQQVIVDTCILSVSTTQTYQLYELVSALSPKWKKGEIVKELKSIPSDLLTKNGGWEVEAPLHVIVALYTDTYNRYTTQEKSKLHKAKALDYYWKYNQTYLKELLEASASNSLSLLPTIVGKFTSSGVNAIKLILLTIYYEQHLNILPFFPDAMLKEGAQHAIRTQLFNFAPIAEFTQKLRRIAALTKSDEITQASFESELLSYLLDGSIQKAKMLIVEHPQLSKGNTYPFYLHYESNSLACNFAADKLGKAWLVKKENRFSTQPLLFKHIFLLSIVQNTVKNGMLLNKLQSNLLEFSSPFDAPFISLLYKSINLQGKAKDIAQRLASISLKDGGFYDIINACLSAFYTGESLPATAIAPIYKMVLELQNASYNTLALEILYMASTIFPQNKEFQHDYRNLVNTLGREALAKQLEQKKEWEYALDQMFSIASNASTKQNTAEARIIYQINFRSEMVVPILQKMGKNGVWNKGRNIALKRFMNNEVEGMLPQDSRIAATIEKNYEYYSESYEFNKNTIWRELIGHPYLFNEAAPSIPIELVLRKPIIIVTKKSGSYALSFDITPTAYKYQLVKETNTRYAYVDQDERQAKLWQALDGGKVLIPSEGEGKLKELIKMLSSSIEIHSDFTNQNVEQRQGDTTIRILMMPVGDNLKAEILVKPLVDKPPYCHPGKGTEVINTTNENNVHIQVVRSMPQEKANAAKLNKAIEHLTFEMEDEFTLLFTEPSDCLHLLEVLQQQPKELCLVEWPEGMQFRLRRQVGLGNFNIMATQKGQWFDVEGSIQVDEQTVISLQELLKMRRAKNRRFIEMGDGEFLALSEALRKRLDEIESSFYDDKSNKISQFSMPLLLEDTKEYGSFKANKMAIDFQKKLKSVDMMVVTLPKNLEAEFRPYQEEGFRWMAKLTEWGAGACLADDMGLGKTIQSIAILLLRAAKGASLVVCPASVLPNWVSELRRFAPSLTPIILNTSNREEVVKGAVAFDVVITTYGLLQSEESLFQSTEWNCLVFDEVHIVKNHQTKTYKAAVELKSQCRIGLTGTPIQNHLGELWSIFNILNPGLLGKQSLFNSMFVAPISQTPDTYQRNILKKRITPFILRRTKGNVLDELPAKTEITISVGLTADEMAFYEAIRREAIENITTTNDAGHKHLRALAELTRLRLASCNARMIDPSITLPSSKLEAFSTLIDELMENNHRALVFSQFTKHLDLIREKLDERGITYQYLDGSTPIPLRGELVKKFQQGDDPLFLISLKAGGLGLNLTAADYVIHLDPWWNPAIEDQATDRAHRIGQQRPVTVYRLVAENTIEEKILRLHQTKRELAEGLLEGADMATKLSAEDMLNLLM